MTREETIQGTVDADIGGAGGDTDIGDIGGSEGGAEGILILVRRGAVGNIDADISGTGGSEGIELEDIGSFRVPRGSGEGAVWNTDAGGSSSRSARLTTGHGGIAQGGRSSIIACCCGGFTFILKNYFQFFDMTREESIQGTVDAGVGGAGGDTDIGGTGGSEGINLEDVGGFGVPRGSGGGAVENIDVDIVGTGGSEGIELEDFSNFEVPRGSGEGAGEY
ncbi:hypothetical protein GH714_018762 [Hevea brasiliensis]|uniref:Uncharacterized protein n=1 Tax=Hevea brasiliensis TaxID=3981 RepID=A0A6A6KW91_HEVBR|nr:hypothetical protein GH714_018762 [Hevea brasiliensis]